MANNYTRQRQGRDFFFYSDSMKKEYGTKRSFLNQPDSFNDEAERSTTLKREDTERRDFLNRLEQLKTEAERSATPIDGHEPAPERGI